MTGSCHTDIALLSKEWAVKSGCLSLTVSTSSLPPTIHVWMFDPSRTLCHAGMNFTLAQDRADPLVSYDIGPWAICVWCGWCGQKRMAVLGLLSRIKPCSFVLESAALRVWKQTAVYYNWWAHCLYKSRWVLIDFCATHSLPIWSIKHWFSLVFPSVFPCDALLCERTRTLLSTWRREIHIWSFLGEGGPVCVLAFNWLSR